MLTIDVVFTLDTVLTFSVNILFCLLFIFLNGPDHSLAFVLYIEFAFYYGHCVDIFYLCYFVIINIF